MSNVLYEENGWECFEADLWHYCFDGWESRGLRCERCGRVYCGECNIEAPDNVTNFLWLKKLMIRSHECCSECASPSAVENARKRGDRYNRNV